VITEVNDDGESVTEATVKIEAGGNVEHTAAEGNGPVMPLDGRAAQGARKSLSGTFGREVTLVDYKSPRLQSKEATARKCWCWDGPPLPRAAGPTVGVSEISSDASWHALVDSVEYKLYRRAAKSGRRKRNGRRP